jgi:hypothetical protein
MRKIGGMMFTRFSPEGSVLRGLVIAAGILTLLWLGYLAMLGEEQRSEGAPLFFAVLLLMVLGLWIGWLCTRKTKPQRNTFWLCHDGESAATGPFSVGQIVTMWQQGQITTRGMVTAEGEEQWEPIMAFADRFDASLPEKKAGFSLRRVVTALLLFFVLLFVIAMLADDGSARRRKSQQVREMLNSPAARSTMADLQRKAKREVARQKGGAQMQSAPPAAMEPENEERIQSALQQAMPPPRLGGN